MQQEPKLSNVVGVQEGAEVNKSYAMLDYEDDQDGEGADAAAGAASDDDSEAAATDTAASEAAVAAAEAAQA